MNNTTLFAVSVSLAVIVACLYSAAVLSFLSYVIAVIPS